MHMKNIIGLIIGLILAFGSLWITPYLADQLLVSDRLQRH